MLKIILILSLSLAISSAQLIQNGQCDPNIQLQSDFRVTDFLGRWFVVRRSGSSISTTDCSHIDISQSNDTISNGTITVYNRGVNDNFLEEITAVANLENGTAKFNFNISDSNESLNFWIITTDYENLALAYSCDNLNATHRNLLLWQLGRTTSYPTNMMEALLNNTLVSLFGLTSSDLVPVDHSAAACEILPDIPAGQPVILPGQCNVNITVVENFNVSAFMGVWHQIATYYSTNGQGTCNRAEYTLLGNVVQVLNSQIVNLTLDAVAGNATVVSNDGSARLSVVLEVAPGVLVESPLSILATDYTNYAVAYVCSNLPNNQKRVNTWIASRSRQLSPTAQQAVNAVINSYVDLNNRFLIQSNQTNEGCFFYPTPVPNQPVTFRGQCEENISVVQNFNVTAYLGLWYNIESYPSLFQPGTCNNAQYTLGDDVVDVFNTQVIDQRLDTINGVAVVASTDGSAKLTVSFPIPGTNLTTSTKYWVLDTDYVNYALVYSCSNVTEDERSIRSWKLSRSKSLQNESIAAINRKIETIPVLDQRYYEVNDQSREGCFYYPEPQAGVPVRFPGQCEDVPVTSNFNLTQFQGRWYEVQAYPKEQQPGQCVSHDFSLNINTFNLTTNGVDDQFAVVSNSIVSLATNDSTAKMTISITVNGGIIQIPYWILSTDYGNYALAYSCINENSDFRMVYSWKLSRTPQLSPASLTAINNTIQEITVLDERYYETVGQSDAACFTLPVIDPGNPIVLNGQCDPNVPVIQNFNITNYSGRWRVIESYTDSQLSGTCNDVSYSQSNGSILVYNSYVNNQDLITTAGSASLASSDGSGKLLVSVPPAANPIEYWILDTDYVSYSLVYNCVNISSTQKRVVSRKLSRSSSLSIDANNRMNQIIRSVQVLNNRYYQPLNQSDNGCFYYPPPSSDTPIIFRGQCDPNINVVQNFNVTEYLGQWYDISSYPTRFQLGTCGNAYYSLNGNVVDVYNTEVINQSLSTIYGVASVASTDNSAKLIVSFPVAGTNLTTSTPYWVLSTDYESYALVYSCVNIDAERRQVSSWKLSRTKVLSANATTAINAVVNTIPVLDDRYYNQENQTTAGCFYFPDPQPGVPVVFPGQCDNSIQAVLNFNMSAFTGTWHEIQAYPKDQQNGQCINHQYISTSTNNMALVSSNIINQILSQTSSNVIFASPQDLSAKLNISFTSGGTNITIPFWVLSTDYSSYALAYSCVNLNESFRAVYSWKLGRTKQLNIYNNLAINNAIENITVLDNKYYENIDQSDDACFFLPDAIPNQPVVFVGQCNENINVVQNFNASRYLGRWRLIESYPQASQRGLCNQATYSLNANGTVDVFNTEVINQELSTINGLAVIASNDSSAKLLVTFPGTTEPAPYWVLDTDYDSYALVYSCRNLANNQRLVTSWKLSRTSALTPNATQNINEIVNSIDVLNDRYYSSVAQTDQACFYFPTPNPDAPVVFRGQCDQNIAVVSNFNVSAYLGQWYDISSYPTRFQQGTCGNAYYSLNGGVVDVFNTEVVNQSLSTINGVARLATTDNSAKLIVSFPIAGTNLTTETPYWVLATDYSSYALVYSCINIDQEYRQVTSWKLSRTKQLDSNAVAPINNVTNTVQVLEDRYYVNTDQSDAGCFYLPEPQTGVPVVFPGQCDQSIQAVPNFNMTMFQGVWYEIAAYPKDQQTGQCINHNYSLNATNILDLVSSNVLNQLQNISSSRVTFASTQDSSGKLSITLSSAGSNIVIPFWVLSVDYDDYALAYSCVNRDQNSRAVYSWKLSRSKQLSLTGNNVINNKISEINVLDNRYYENIDQSDAACFYLPDVNPGQSVVFPGQCDPNIPVVQNFNAVAYTGRWRMIESYPSNFQDVSATCSDATYTLSGGVVDVVNTQVINQTLDVVLGNATLATTDGSAKLLVNFPNSPAPSDYWVLSTDYSSYALVYSCRNISSTQHQVTSWKLSRTSALTLNATQNINQIVNSIDVLNDRYYSSVAQTDQACFYFPTPNNDAPVVFRGQCDQNIAVVSNFNVSAYLGQWYDISSYPTRFQQGTCGNAYYSLNGGAVDVFNTEVVNQSLSTINGVARLATTDNSAKLIVSFPIAGTNLTTETPYWVLATDYSSYALVYSCINIDQQNRQVTSWKLSRSKQLASSALAPINNIINNVQVLEDRYYVNTDQSDAGCFYLPEPQLGVPVVFPGQCDQSIQAVSNFNMTAFQGIWHEISAYPKDQQTGQCINHDYSLNTTNILDLVSSNVINQLKNISSSRVTFATAQDSSGKLSITLSGSNIVIPFWILSTDYTDYALAYSCVNRDQNSRTVYSWKLSRSKLLSLAGNNVINNKISEINVLDNKYYENINQSDAACFYLPDVSPGQPVLFPGQCDVNIPVVQNFNAVAYSGRWRMIESYASDFQNANASCSDATYTLSEGVVDVVNTQVINRTLDVINGNATLASTDGSAKLLVHFPNSPGPSDYWVLSTDYNSYALVYSCRNVGTTQRRVYSWKLSRTRDLSANATTEINRVINSINVLNQRYYSSVEHSESACFYYPKADGSPVVFRGQCDGNIPVVTNFNATAYMNTWYDIESYPVRFQDGTCPTATYTLGSVVDVYNTQVVGQQLDTINGVAVFAGNASEAKLSVSFPIAGTNLTTSSPYWVLSTDYVNYALVYSCSNIDEEYYRIGSWKLSRQRSLASAAATTINTVMNSIPVLRQDYYVERGHSDENCFYYPNNNGGPVIQNGQCDFSSLSVVNNFNSSLFSGPWYEISRYPSELQEGECVSAQFEVNNQQFTMSKNIVFNERQITLIGPATPVETGQGILNVNLTGQGVNFATTFYVLDVDYNDFALLYSCVNFNSSSKQVYSWKLSRSQQGLSENAENRIVDVVNRTRDLFQGYYETTDQNTTGCFHYPEYTELPDQIELIGPCDESIRAKANFSVQDYLGKWYEIASYPQPFQSGECPRAQYSASNVSSSVTVLNTQVINRELAVQYATAVVASNDGSGLLEVTFVLQNGVTSVVNYYVLETDYTSFSLVYSCRNLPSGNRLVSSWKLSRSTTLSPQAVPIIDSIISNTQGLNEKFYKPANQSREACFYVPEVNKNESPRFRGQCDNIQSVQGFDAQRFLGWWHEIESYPTNEDRGTCISSEYSQVGNTFQVVDTNVFGLSARINRSDVVISNNGRLTRTVNGQSVDVWVLATDYDDYALLYSCENIDSNYRQVWSGKYSKTRELSENAQNAIAAAIQREETLEPQFFQNVNQSDDACFHYPEPTGNPVILPGNCDQNIPVVSNFSAVNYSGVWYQIEKYPQIHENGTCVGARYTFNENTEVVDVLNWQVIDGVLDSVPGNATLISDDGSAKLLVNLPIRFTDDPEPQMVSMELYVLATDYLSYSLAYSCVNVGPYRRSVGVWKLSRTRTLLPQGAQVINSLIETRQELNQSYFLSVEQNDDCDEPSSAIFVRSSIIIMILCSILHLL